jgi:hypothetical protein
MLHRLSETNHTTGGFLSNCRAELKDNQPKVQKRTIQQTKRAGTRSLPVPLRATAEIDPRLVRHRGAAIQCTNVTTTLHLITNNIARLSNKIY